MNKKTLLLISIQCCCLSLLTYAQHDSTAVKTTVPVIAEVTLSGLVYNASGVPVSAATVQLYNTDSSMVAATHTDTLGVYLFNHIKIRDYLLIFRHVSYPPKYLPLPADTLSQLKGYLITILEGDKIIGLPGVNIVGRKNSVLKKIPEGFSFPIDERFSKLTIWEVLKRTPFVNAREDGTLNVVGKSGVVVYINGRKSNLSGNELLEFLRNMSSENLQSLEIITAPSSKYEAQGNAGIINLVLKRQLDEGLLGSVSLINEFAYYNTYRANGNLNYARGKVASQLSLRGARNKNRITEDGDVSLQTLNMKNSSFLDRNEGSYPVGATWINDIAFKDNHRLNVQANGSYSDGYLHWYTTNQFSRLQTGKPDSTLTTDSRQKQTTNSFNIDINDQIKLDTLGSSLSAGVSFFSQQGDNNSPYKIISPSGNYFFQTTSLQRFKNYATQIDYHKAFKPALSIDVGARVNRNESVNRNTFDNLIKGDYVQDRSKENDYDYRETIYALYASLNWSISEKLNTVLGARLEQTDIKGYEAIAAASLTKNLTNLFPNVSISYDFNSNHKLGLNINSRIDRPAFWELNPTPVYTSPITYAKGNAFLLPARSLNFELSYMLHQKLTFLLNYNHLNNDRMQFQVTKQGSNIIAYDRFNYGKHNQAVLGINYNDQFFDRVRIGANLEANHNRFTGAIPIKSIDLTSWQMSGRIRGDVDLDKKGRASLYLSYFYYSPVRTAQGYDRTWQLLEMGGMIKTGKFIVQVSSQGLLNTGLARFGNENEGVSDSYVVINSSLSRLVVTLSYSFGNTHTRKAESGGAANEEQKSRVQ